MTAVGAELVIVFPISCPCGPTSGGLAPWPQPTRSAEQITAASPADHVADRDRSGRRITAGCIGNGRYERPDSKARFTALTVQQLCRRESARERREVTGLVPNPPWSDTPRASRRHLAPLLGRNLADNTHGAWIVGCRRHELPHSLCRATLFRTDGRRTHSGRGARPVARGPGRLRQRRRAQTTGPAYRDGAECQLMRWLISSTEGAERTALGGRDFFGTDDGYAESRCRSPSPCLKRCLTGLPAPSNLGRRVPLPWPTDRARRQPSSEATAGTAGLTG